MSGTDETDAVSLFQATLNECRHLYVSSGRLCSQQYPHLIQKSGEDFVQLMDDLHRGLVLKIYMSVCQADREWSIPERELAKVLFHHLWGKQLAGEQLRDAAREAAKDSESLEWYSLVRPFDRITPLRERISALETIVMRLANLVARCDGVLKDSEAAAIQSIRDELRLPLRPSPTEEPRKHEERSASSGNAIASMQQHASAVREATAAQARLPASESQVPQPTADLQTVLAELDELIGLSKVK